MSVLLLIVILIFKYMKNDEVIWVLFSAASYTYGPLLGLFMFGVLTNRRTADWTTVGISVVVALSLFLFMKLYFEPNFEYVFG